MKTRTDAATVNCKCSATYVMQGLERELAAAQKELAESQAAHDVTRKLWDADKKELEFRRKELFEMRDAGQLESLRVELAATRVRLAEARALVETKRFQCLDLLKTRDEANERLDGATRCLEAQMDEIADANAYLERKHTSVHEAASMWRIEQESKDGAATEREP